MLNKRDITILKVSPTVEAVSKLSFPFIPTGSTCQNRRCGAQPRTNRGLKARKALAQSNALWHRRYPTPEAPTGRNQYCYLKILWHNHYQKYMYISHSAQRTAIRLLTPK
jgi:hypothetical protein